jgi:hypothetical protein
MARIPTITEDAQRVAKMGVNNVMKHHALIARAVSVLRVAAKMVFAASGKTVMRVPMAVVTKGMLGDMAVLPNTV